MAACVHNASHLSALHNHKVLVRDGAHVEVEAIHAVSAGGATDDVLGRGYHQIVRPRAGYHHHHDGLGVGVVPGHHEAALAEDGQVGVLVVDHGASALQGHLSSVGQGVSHVVVADEHSTDTAVGLVGVGEHHVAVVQVVHGEPVVGDRPGKVDVVLDLQGHVRLDGDQPSADHLPGLRAVEHASRSRDHVMVGVQTGNAVEMQTEMNGLFLLEDQLGTLTASLPMTNGGVQEGISLKDHGEGLVVQVVEVGEIIVIILDNDVLSLQELHRHFIVLTG